MEEGVEIPSELEAELRQSLIGSARLKLYAACAQREHIVPTRHQELRLVRLQARRSTTIAKIHDAVLTQSIFWTDFSELRSPGASADFLAHLEEHPFQRPILLEVKRCPPPLAERLAMVAWCERLKGGGWVYTLASFDERLLEGFCLLLEIRASKHRPEPFLSIFGGAAPRWQSFSLKEHSATPWGPLALMLLDAMNTQREVTDRVLVPFHERDQVFFVENDKLTPPDDPEFTRRLQAVIRGEMRCTRAITRISKIEPHDVEFGFSYPKAIVETFAREVQRGTRLEPLIYWHDGRFLMTDDYAAYLAYQQQRQDRIPVVIMGPFPQEEAEVIEQGGAELIPPFGVRWRDAEALSPLHKKWMLERHFRSSPISKTDTLLQATYLILARLIENPYTSESDLHNFLRGNPVALDAYGHDLASEMNLGGKFRVDLAIQYNQSDKRIALIELERASLPVFTKTGRFTSKVTHAVQQVEDWMRWWREHPEQVPRPFDASIPLEGCVIIGRNRDWSDEARKRLLHLNENRKIKVLTYDDLLDKLDRLIERSRDGR